MRARWFWKAFKLIYKYVQPKNCSMFHFFHSSVFPFSSVFPSVRVSKLLPFFAGTVFTSALKTSQRGGVISTCMYCDILFFRCGRKPIRHKRHLSSLPHIIILHIPSNASVTPASPMSSADPIINLVFPEIKFKVRNMSIYNWPLTSLSVQSGRPFPSAAWVCILKGFLTSSMWMESLLGQLYWAWALR